MTRIPATGELVAYDGHLWHVADVDAETCDLERRDATGERHRTPVPLRLVDGCTCPTLSGHKIRGSACPIHGFATTTWS